MRARAPRRSRSRRSSSPRRCTSSARTRRIRCVAPNGPSLLERGFLKACCPMQYAAVDRLERAIESIQSTIEDQGGSLVVKMKVRSTLSSSSFLSRTYFRLIMRHRLHAAQSGLGDGRAGPRAAHGQSGRRKRRSVRRRRGGGYVEPTCTIQLSLPPTHPVAIASSLYP